MCDKKKKNVSNSTYFKIEIKTLRITDNFFNIMMMYRRLDFVENMGSIITKIWVVSLPKYG